MMRFDYYFDKKVKAITKIGNVFIGDVISFASSIMNEDDYGKAQGSIYIMHDGYATVLFEDEIASIEVLEEDD